MKDISDWTIEIGSLADEKGWWPEGKHRSIGDLIALCHAELSEALEAYREDEDPNYVWMREDGKPEGFGYELADTIIDESGLHERS